MEYCSKKYIGVLNSCKQYRESFPHVIGFASNRPYSKEWKLIEKSSKGTFTTLSATNGFNFVICKSTVAI